MNFTDKRLLSKISFIIALLWFIAQIVCIIVYWGDPTKAKTKLGWNPQKTGYEELCAIMAKHDLELAKKEAGVK